MVMMMMIYIYIYICVCVCVCVCQLLLLLDILYFLSFFFFQIQQVFIACLPSRFLCNPFCVYRPLHYKFTIHSVKISLHNFLQTNLSASPFEIRTAAETHMSTTSFLPKNEIYSHICKAVSNISSTDMIFWGQCGGRGRTGRNIVLCNPVLSGGPGVLPMGKN